MRETKTYVLKNLAGQERTIVLNHSPETEWKVVNPTPPAEQKEPGLQLKVTLRGGETASREIVEERYRFDDTLLQSLGERGMHYFIDNKAASPAVKDALRKVLALRQKLAETQKHRSECEQQLKGIADEQARLRANLEKLPATSAAYKRYLEKFDAQETEIEKLQGQIKHDQASERQRQQEYDQFLANLTVE